MEQLSIEEGGIEEYVTDEEVCILVSVSRFQNECGRGRQSNFFNLDDCRTYPDSLSNMNSITWCRMKADIARVKWNVGCIVVPIMLAVIAPFFVVLYTMPDDATMDNHPKRIIFFCAWSVFTCIVLYFASKKEKEILNEGVQKVVSAMASRFAWLGYNVKFVVEYDCNLGYCSYLRFVPQEAISDAFNFDDWKQLEGKWEQTDQSRVYKSWLTSVRQSFEFRTEPCADDFIQEDPAGANTFFSEMKTECCVLWKQFVLPTFTGKTAGNTHVLTNASGGEEGKRISITPIKTNGMVSSYNWDNKAILIVQGSTMLKIHLDLDDIPPASVLSSVGFRLKEGREWVEMRKTAGYDLSRTIPAIV
jgi:hypothetical protein